MAQTLYIFHGSPPARTVMVTAKALGVPLSIHAFSSNEELQTPEYLQLNPNHTVPTLVDSDVILGDSHAITPYLVAKYGKNDALYPKDIHKRALIDQKLHLDTGILFPLVRTVVLGLMKKHFTEVPARIIEEIKEAYALMNKILGDNQWVAGTSVSIADFSCYTSVTSLNVITTIDPIACPNLINWLKCMQSLPYFSSDGEEIQHFKAFYDSIHT